MWNVTENQQYCKKQVPVIKCVAESVYAISIHQVKAWLKMVVVIAEPSETLQVRRAATIAEHYLFLQSELDFPMRSMYNRICPKN